ncbi:amidoligase family protein [Caenispirillum bisanense]|uniref:amidoligase family protein n=1 Tax=Caenispirillum bisanense TaxID=414052 RepID=UPI0031E3497D
MIAHQIAHQIVPGPPTRGGPLRMPPHRHTAEGRDRRVGVEVEFAGLDARSAAVLVQGLFGGRVRECDPYRFAVEDTSFGTFLCELDSQYAHPTDKSIPKSGKAAELIERLRDRFASTFGEVSSHWLPVEIVSPPVPLGRLHELELVLESLRDRGAEDTGASVFYAFALQFNPEAARLEVDHILAVMRAYVLLEDWLKSRIGPDQTRRLLLFATDFPGEWGRYVLRPEYAPDLGQFIDDYARFNPTRNRGLDLYPLLCHLDEARVRQLAPDPLIKARPTFHYRLPDARLSDPGWSLAAEWNDWVEVERLADDPPRLAAMADAWMRHRGRSEFGSRARWAAEAALWVPA